MKKLSNYTHAKYCTDINDCICGIEELNKAITNRRNNNQSIPSYYYSRRNKLYFKFEKLRKKANIKPNIFEYNGHAFEAVSQFNLLEIDLYTPEKAKVVHIEDWDYNDFNVRADIIAHQQVDLAYADIFLMDNKYYVAACFENLYYCIGEPQKK